MKSGFDPSHPYATLRRIARIRMVESEKRAVMVKIVGCMPGFEEVALPRSSKRRDVIRILAEDADFKTFFQGVSRAACEVLAGAARADRFEHRMESDDTVQRLFPDALLHIVVKLPIGAGEQSAPGFLASRRSDEQSCHPYLLHVSSLDVVFCNTPVPLQDLRRSVEPEQARVSVMPLYYVSACSSACLRRRIYCSKSRC